MKKREKYRKKGMEEREKKRKRKQTTYYNMQTRGEREVARGLQTNHYLAARYWCYNWLMGIFFFLLPAPASLAIWAYISSSKSS